MPDVNLTSDHATDLTVQPKTPLSAKSIEDFLTTKEMNMLNDEAITHDAKGTKLMRTFYDDVQSNQVIHSDIYPNSTTNILPPRKESHDLSELNVSDTEDFYKTDLVEMMDYSFPCGDDDD